MYQTLGYKVLVYYKIYQVSLFDVLQYDKKELIGP